jgi:hypothetical protein
MTVDMDHSRLLAIQNSLDCGTLTPSDRRKPGFEFEEAVVVRGNQRSVKAEEAFNHVGILYGK